MDLKFDIETIPAGNPEDIELTPPANYKNPETIQKWMDENRDTEFRKRALHGISGEIASIAWQRGDDRIKCITRNSEMSESALLTQFFSWVMDGEEWPRIKWIGHNNIEFDLRYLKQRCWINNVRPALVIPADAKHGEWAFDVMKEWAGWRGYVSQDALYRALGGQPYEDDDMDGSMVYDAWLAGDYDKIREYNIRDVEKLSYNYDRLVGKWVPA